MASSILYSTSKMDQISPMFCSGRLENDGTWPAVTHIVIDFLQGTLQFSRLRTMPTRVLVQVFKTSVHALQIDDLANWAVVAMADQVSLVLGPGRQYSPCVADVLALLVEYPVLIRPMRALMAPDAWAYFPPTLATLAPPREPKWDNRKTYIWSIIGELRAPWTGDGSLSMTLRRRIHTLENLIQCPRDGFGFDFVTLMLGTMQVPLLVDLYTTACSVQGERLLIRAIGQVLGDMGALDAIGQDDSETCAALGLCFLRKELE
jgi:hypothetical protein